MGFIMLTVLIDMIAIGLIIPVLPRLVGTFTSPPTEQTFWFGAVALSFGLSNFFASPIIGALSGLLGIVSHLPKGDWRMGLPFCFCAALQMIGTGVLFQHFHRGHGKAMA